MKYRNSNPFLKVLILIAVLLVLLTCTVYAMKKIGVSEAKSSDNTASKTVDTSFAHKNMAGDFEVKPDTWVFTDALGRKSYINADVGDPKDDKTVGMFYWIWHAYFSNTDFAFNIQEYLDEHPEITDYSNYSKWPIGSYKYFWDEPIYGYYRSDDPWVLRRQGEMLANAGIDVVFTDNTNGSFTWRESYLPLLDSWKNALKDGVNVPKFSVMLPFAKGQNTVNQMTTIFKDVYQTDEYKDLWFYWDNKPMVLGYKDSFNSSIPIQSTIANFFTFRKNNASYTSVSDLLGYWGWLNVYPQKAYYKNSEDKANNHVEQISVGVALNHSYYYNSLAPMNGYKIMGRSYTKKDGYHTEEGASLYGYQFAEQFDYAIEKNPDIIFITGYNEWVADLHSNWPNNSASSAPYAFPDEFNDEYSRDIEPTKGALKDNYYYQTVNYIRKYKGVRDIPSVGPEKTIELNGDITQWYNVAPYYASYQNNTESRDSLGYAGLYYLDYSGRNDIIGSKISRDKDNVYFLCECKDNITPYTDPLWMVLYIDCDQDNHGWNTFDYVINKTSPTATEAYIEQFTGTDYQSKIIGKVEYEVIGQYIQIKVPKSLLNLGDDNFVINFVWTDNVHDEDDNSLDDPDPTYLYTRFSGDIMDFYTSGDVAPGGRFKYSYDTSKELPFGDVIEGKWYFDYVMYCYDNQYMSGTGIGTFSPDSDLTRSMFVTILYKIDGSTETFDTLSFYDNVKGKWFYNAVEWASNKGYTSGIGNNLFGINVPITRETLAQFFYKYSLLKGYDVSNLAELDGYRDISKVHNWALTGMKWAVASNLVTGTGNNMLSPQSNASRATVATMVKNFVENINK